MRKAGTSGAITRQAIREAAIELIATHGFESMSLRELAAKCGIKAGYCTTTSARSRICFAICSRT